ncbi:ACT domain-containing protein ACR4 [Zea mays]|uniref:ACT domain-containing protein ACR n=1 Tax=Zea mays TaxID=4577 RepID=A0A317YHZ1_MAIZE|nr:ACT domain-containing protein ACR4 [Zea mays]
MEGESSAWIGYPSLCPCANKRGRPVASMEPHHGTRTAISTTDLRARLPQLAPPRHCELRRAQPPLRRVGPPASVAVPPPPTTATGPATNGRRVPRIYWVIGSVYRSTTASSCHLWFDSILSEVFVSFHEAALADEKAECSSWDSDDEYQKFIQNMNPPRVTIDNTSCPSATVINVDSTNKYGILLEVVQVLAILKLIVTKAYISSDGGWFMDAVHFVGRKVSTDEGEAKAQEHGAMFMETSAKAGFNVKPLFRKIAGSLPGLDALSTGKQEDMVDINLRPASGSSASGQVQPRSWSRNQAVAPVETSTVLCLEKLQQYGNIELSTFREIVTKIVFAQTSSSDILTSIARSQFLCTDLFSKLSYARI